MRKIEFAEGEFYHVYNRGVDKRRIFTSPGEYRRFQAYLLAMNSEKTERSNYKITTQNLQGLALQKSHMPLIAIGAYCLMPNHFHLYVTPLAGDGISRFMQRLQTAYTMYFNEKHERTGALFQGTFKAEHVDTDEYAKYLFSYIHLNPAKLKDKRWKEVGPRNFNALRRFVSEYPYSSLFDYIKNTHQVTDPSKFPQYLSSATNVNDHIDFWLRFREPFARLSLANTQRGFANQKMLTFVAGVLVVVLAGYLLFFAPKLQPQPTAYSPQAEEVMTKPYETYIGSSEITIMRPATSEVWNGDYKQFLPVTQHTIVGISLLRDYAASLGMKEAVVFVGSSKNAAALSACSQEWQPTQETKIEGVVINNIPFAAFHTTGQAHGETYDLTTYRASVKGTCFEISKLMHFQGENENTEKVSKILDGLVQTFRIKG